MCKTIKSGTILRYLSAAAKFSIPVNMVNPCLNIIGKQSTYINAIINELKRWESMHNCREPITK